MADSKITALASIGTGTDPANDPLVIVDVSDVSPGGMSATGTTKKVTLNNLLACSPTATLASATISGDLTVDTSTLKVDSVNNRVGVNTASPLTNLHVGSGAGLTGLGIGLSRGATANFFEAFDGTKTFIGGTDSANAGVKVGSLSNHSVFLVCNNITQLQIDPLGVFSFTDGAGGTRMTLNATGLGVGVSPAFKLDIAGSIQSTSDVRIKKTGSDTFASGPFVYLNSGDGGGNGSALQLNAANGLDFWNSTGGTWSKRMTLDISGNLSLQSDKYLGWGNLDSLIYGSSTSNYIYFRTNATERVRVKGGGQLRFIPLAADPAGAEAGDVYYNSVSNRLKYYNGTAWTLI